MSGRVLILALLVASGSAAAQQQDCPDCPEMVKVPLGGFLMGSSRDDYENDLASGETPALPVTVRQDFWIGRFEVTRAQWSAFRAAVPGADASPACEPGSRAPAAPVTCISRSAVSDYLAWLSVKTGQHYRLPSEAEWEYAARAGSRGARFWSNRDSHEGVSISRACDFGNVYDVSARDPARTDPHARCADGYAQLAPVGSFLPNDFGLYDTTGNARERVADCFTRSYKGRPQDERTWDWDGCRYHGVRGGSYLTRPIGVRSAARDYVDDGASSAAPDLGFRVVRDARP
jgi:formylglycine-generating enzyme required for sulfatase activity